VNFLDFGRQSQTRRPIVSNTKIKTKLKRAQSCKQKICTAACSLFVLQPLEITACGQQQREPDIGLRGHDAPNRLKQA
jgi:hypothetical protein